MCGYRTTEPYSTIGRKKEQHNALREEERRNSREIRIIKPKILRALQHIASTCLPGHKERERVKPMSSTESPADLSGRS